ncbi:MAG: ABC transporter permease [Verrucomicrobia bacterium]|nr:MAG: ABC transporter permease [Verrucomicrobiota bacterium]
MNDFRFAFRQLLKNPGFTAVAVLTLALGIGANTAIFSVVNGVLLRPLPFPAADRLVMIHTIHRHEGRTDRFETVFDPDFKEWIEQNRAFEHMAAYGSGQATLLSGGEPERIGSAEVTIDFFALLGVKPLAGRTFLPEEHQAGGPRAVMLSEGLWRDRFGANPSIIGQGITLDGKNVTVVGVLPSSFNFASDCDVWRSLVLDTRRNNAVHRAVACLKPDVTREQAQAEMDAIAQRLAQTRPASAPGVGVDLVSLQEYIVGGTRSLLFVFLGAVGFVLLIACANVTNLLLARAAARQKEIQIRVALGAGQARIARHLLTESVLLAVGGGVLGLLLAVWGLDLLIALMPPNLVPRIGEVGLDVRVLGFNFTLSLLTGIAFGLAPAWQASRVNANEALKEGGRSQSPGARQRFLRQSLVSAEIAVSIVLLIGAGLMLRSFARLRDVKLGFNPERTLTLNLSLPGASYPGPERIKAFYREVLDRVGALPGVRATGFANAVPLGGGSMRLYGDFAAEGRPASETSWASKIAASPDYFRALGIPLRKGRFFVETDDDRSQGVAIINESLARRLWPGSDALGQRIQIGLGGKSQPWLEVVGVVSDVRQDDLRVAPPPGIYVPYQQVSQTFFLDTMTFVVRTGEEPRALAALLRKTIQTVDPTLPVFDIHTMEEWVSFKVAHPRFNTWLLGSFSAIALVLALVGIYGVVSYGVTQRTQEIGIRLALGARGQDVLKMVVGQGMRAVLVGVLCGSIVAVALTRFLTAQLYSVTPTDPITFASVVLIFISVAVLACLVPALRAARVDPMEALRYE